MRISDWSSDVCSSDLRHTCCLHLRCAQPPKQLGPAEGEERTVQRLQHLVEIWQRDHEGDRFALELGDLYQVLEGDRLELLAGKLGRASCREEGVSTVRFWLLTDT